jgi:integrase
LAGLRRAFALAVRAAKASYRLYIPSTSIDNARRGFFEPAEIEALSEGLSETLHPFMCLLYLADSPAGEARGLTRANVDFDAGVVRLEPGTTKSDEGRKFPFSALAPLAELLEEQRERTKTLERQ